MENQFVPSVTITLSEYKTLKEENKKFKETIKNDKVVFSKDNYYRIWYFDCRDTFIEELIKERENLKKELMDKKK